MAVKLIDLTLAEKNHPARLGAGSHTLVVTTFGAQPPLRDSAAPLAGTLRAYGLHQRYLSSHLRSRPLLMAKPPGINDTHFKFPIISIGEFGEVGTVHGPAILVCDAVVIAPDIVVDVAMQTRDCPVIVLFNTKTGTFACVHGMRDLLAPDREGNNLLSRTLDLVAPRLNERPHVQLYATAGISAANFPNRPEKAEPFLSRYGERVFHEMTGYRLDLFLVAKATVVEMGVPGENCRRDGLCTVDAKWLGSLRANKPGPNTVFMARG